MTAASAAVRSSTAISASFIRSSSRPSLVRPTTRTIDAPAPAPLAASCSMRSFAGVVGDDHWKISVVQSPPWRRTSWARAGPPGRSWKSTKKSGSISIPPSGSQFDPQEPRAQPGIELVVPGRVERVRDVEATPVERELQHVRAAVERRAARRSACRARRRARPARSASGSAGSETSYWRTSPCSQFEK